PLDEIAWRTQVDFEGGIHSNTILYYFAKSPFFDKTSNNEVVFQQGLTNPNMTQYLTTRELFEGRLKTMSGLEFVVAQEPAETGPGAGTGVWVINKQTRRKRHGEEDEVVVHAVYFMVGENVYMAPTLADIISAKVATISTNVARILPIAESVQTWSPSLGRVYQTPKEAAAASTTKQQRGGLESRADTPMPEVTGAAAGKAAAATSDKSSALLDAMLVEESLVLHDRFGGEYMDENPITGKPGEFLLSSTGRKEAPKNVGPITLKEVQILPALDTKVGDNPLARSGKETKSPK
ncbi:MED6 mediator sub complex component-domain-containing protein, partial [Bombardia bombarda]